MDASVEVAVLADRSMIATVLGFVAAFCTTAAFIPQVIHTLRTRDVSGISLGMYAIFSIGVFGWMLYGLLIEAWPIIIANALTLVLAVSVLVLKIKHR